MNKETHKTIQVLATIETYLYLDINVPIGTDEDDIWQFIRDGNIDGSDMLQYDGFISDGWRWEEPIYDYEFDPKAYDASKEILKS
jgi:hypothetical protein